VKNQSVQHIRDFVKSIFPRFVELLMNRIWINISFVHVKSYW